MAKQPISDNNKQEMKRLKRDILQKEQAVSQKKEQLINAQNRLRELNTEYSALLLDLQSLKVEFETISKTVADEL